MPLRPFITACVLAGVALASYTFHLTSTPLSAAETVFAQQAQHALASHPLMFHVADDRWLQPVAVYASALVRAVGGGDYSGRIASAVAGALDVALLFGVMRLVASYRVAVVAALVLLGTPAHFWFARVGTDAIFPVPFVLGWLIAALRFVHFDSRRALVAGGLVLGAGVYTHPTSPLVMGWLLAALVLAAIVGRRSIATLVIATGAFVVMLAPLAAWFWLHPANYADTYGRWAVFAAHARFPLDGLRAQVNWNTLSNRTSIFWGLLDPSFLLFPATSKAIAPFLLVSAITVPLGVARALSAPLSAERVVVIAAAVVPPLMACTFGQPQDLGLVVAMSAAAAVLTGYGLSSLPQRRRWWAWLVGAAALASLYQLAPL